MWHSVNPNKVPYWKSQRLHVLFTMQNSEGVPQDCKIFKRGKYSFMDINIFYLIRYSFRNVRNNVKKLHLYFQGKELRLLRCKYILGALIFQSISTTTLWGRINAIMIIFFQMKSWCLDIVINLIKPIYLRAGSGI